YSVEGPPVLEWAAHTGPHTFVGGGERIFEIVFAESSPAGPVKLIPLGSTVRPPPAVVLKPELSIAQLEEQPHKEASPGVRPLSSSVGSSVGSAMGPRLDTVEATSGMPDGVTFVGSSERGLLVGTRFLGFERIENGVRRRFRANDLLTGAQRLTVACVGGG